MRLCRDCRWFGGSDSTPYDECECRCPDSSTVRVDYVDGERTDVYPTCQESREAKIVNYCGNEGRFWEAK